MGLGSVKKYVTRLGGRGLAKKMTKCDIGGRGSKPRSDVLPQKNIISYIVLWLVSVACYHHYINIFFVVVHLDNAFCIENMLNLANIETKVHIKLRLIFNPKFVIFGGVTRGRGSKIKYDKVWHEGGVRNVDILSYMLFEWPLSYKVKNIKYLLTQSNTSNSD